MKEKKIIFLVEDDPQQSASIKAAIERRYRHAEVELLETEGDFWDRIAEANTRLARPCMVITDVMLPWTFPSPTPKTVPPEVKEGTFRKAGLRCWRKFREQDHFKKIPWIYFTVLDEKTIELERNSDDWTGYAQKSSSISPLLEEIAEFFSSDEEWLETEGQVSEKLLTSPKMRRLLLDGMSTPLSECINTVLPYAIHDFLLSPGTR